MSEKKSDKITKVSSEKLKERSKQISQSISKSKSEEKINVKDIQSADSKKSTDPKPAVKSKPVIKAKAKPKEEKPKEPAKPYPFPEALKEVRNSSKKRKFPQTFDLAINVKGIDLKRPENRFNSELQLPRGRGKNVKIAVIADSLAAEAEKKGADIVIKRAEIASLAKDKKKFKNIANQVDWFFGEISLMPVIGKSFGIVLGPRGKVPKPVPPNANIEILMKRAKDSVRIILKETPVIHIPIGTEDMKDEDILKNLDSVYSFVKEKLPKGMNSIKSMFIKLTMSKPVKLEVR